MSAHVDKQVYYDPVACCVHCQRDLIYGLPEYLETNSSDGMVRSI
jgi:hypothetical protein